MALEVDRIVKQTAEDLKRAEGFKAYAYPDPLSIVAKKYRAYPWGDKPASEILAMIGPVDLDQGAPWTVGYGFTNGVNPSSTITQIQADRKLEGLVLDMNGVLYNTLSWYKDASFVTKTILINMAFNMGLKGLLTFKNTLKYIAAKDYKNAAQNMQLSRWFQQVGGRAKELVQRMSTQTIEPQHLVG